MPEQKFIDGTHEIVFGSWREFSDFLIGGFHSYSSYIFRGQAHPQWLLEPTIDRLMKSMGKDIDPDQLAFRHLSMFMKSTRGRRGSSPPKIENEDDWWALGQHHGLATPLLDWTNSPYVAAFFAYEGDNKVDTEHVAIYALHIPNVVEKSNEMKIEYEGKEEREKRPPYISFISPFTDENPRLINQAGLFTRGPYLVDLWSWVTGNFKDTHSKVVLMKFLVPSKDRNDALIAMNRMNISHMTLFPDLSGASQFCNQILTIKDYHFA